MTVVFNTPTTSRVNPQKKNILIRRLARSPWWLLGMIGLIIVFVLSIRTTHPYR